MAVLTRTIPLCSIAIALLALLAGGCAMHDSAPVESLDPVTGASTGRAETPLRFYRDISGRAAHARDFLYLGPLWVNTMGDYRYYLWIGAWSTHASFRDDTKRRDALEAVTIMADGEPLSFELATWTHDDAGVSTPVYDKPVATAVDAYYRVTLDQVRLLAEARELTIILATGNNARYELWSDESRGREALQRFVSR